MAKQLNVNLAFTADTGKAKQQIQDLQNQLTKFLNQPMSGFGDALTKDIKEASKAAAELKVHLEKATNPNTGTLDFSKLNQSMKQANTSISQYAAKIRDMGPEGQKSFMMLAQSVAAAEVPIRRSNALLDEMWTTMKNTMRWQISSSILHGFMGAISSATGYAKDLNESLNNIRIVTSQSVDQMAKFAENANKAAKALSTTTTEYTNAALIYYQQGLSDKDVLARTDITVKMANVAGESAQKVSDQLTAVWNNFHDGSKSLEYYADVMTALGAETASSTDEISEGLNKFAAVAETVGLSYEYAASALATVTATTRQSADIVGTAFKTLFARVQDLELGKTLDDGTSLGKYSAALAAVGVNIKDSNGGLKEMDQILNEMAAKWDTLNKDQQVSLAQTVAGVRQYTQLIALMDNWDFMQENLATSYGSTGALQEQADIYEESWQAASDRVRSALEEIYATLIDDEAFIDILNGIEKVISGFDYLIDRAGGLKGVISILGTVLTNVFSKQLIESLQNVGYNLQNLTEKGRQKVQQKKYDALSELLGQIPKSASEDSVEGVQAKILKDQLLSQQQIIANAKNLTDEEQKVLQILLDQKKARGDAAIEAAKELSLARDEQAEARYQAYGETGDVNLLNEVSKRARAVAAFEWNHQNSDELTQEEVAKYHRLVELLNDSVSEGDAGLQRYADSVRRVFTANKNLQGKKNEAEGILEIPKIKSRQMVLEEEAGKAAEKARLAAAEASMAAEDAIKAETVAVEKKIKAEERAAAVQKSSKKHSNQRRKAAEAEREAEEAATEAIKKKTEADIKATEAARLKAEAEEKANRAYGVKLSAQSFVQISSAVMGTVSAISMLGSAWDAIKDPDLSGWEKLTRTMSSLTMTLPALANSFNQLRKTEITEGGKTLGEAAAMSKLGKAISGMGKSGEAAAAGTASLGVQIGALAAYAAIAVAVIAVLAALVKDTVEIYNADAIAAERAAQAHKNLKEKSEQAKQELESAKSIFDNYTSSLEKFSESADKAGDSLKKVQDNILDILEQYPELAKYENLFNNDGTLNKQVIDKFIADKEIVAQKAQMATILGSAKNSEAQVISKTTDLSRAMGSDRNIGTGILGTEPLLKELIENWNSEDSAENKFLKNEEIIENFINGLDEAEYDIDKVRDALNGYEGQIKSLAAETKNASTQMSNIGTIIANQVLGQTTDEDSDTVTAEYAAAYDKAYDETYNRVMSSGTQGINRSSGRNDKDVQALWDEYLKVTGYDYKLASDAVIGNDRNRSFQYIKDGQTYEIPLEEMAAAIGSATADSMAQAELFKRNESGQFSQDSLFANLNGIALDENLSPEILNQLRGRLNQVDAETAEKIKGSFNEDQTAQEQEKLIKEILGIKTDEFTVNINADSEKYGLEAENVRNYAESLEDLAGVSEDVSKDLKNNEKAVSNVAVANSRMNKGLVTLAENFDDYRTILDNSSEGSEEYQTALKGISAALNDVLGLDDVELSDEFLTNAENLDLMAQAANGSAEAVEELRALAANDILQNVKLNVQDGEESVVRQELINVANDLQNFLNENDLKIGTTLDTTGTYEKFNELIEKSGMTAAQVQDYFNALGYTPELEYTEGEQVITHTGHIPQVKYGKDGSIASVEPYVYTWEENAKVQIPKIKSLTYHGNAGKTINTNSVSKAGGGGGGSKPKTAKPVKKSDTVDRYKEVNDSIEDLQHNLDISNKKADALWGEARFKEMRKGVEILKEENKLLEEKANLANAYLAEDTAALKKAAGAAGINFTFNADGNISNYTTEMTKLWTQLDNAITSANRDGNVSDSEQERIDKIQEKIDAIKDAIEQYEDTLKTKQDIDQEYLDNQIEIWDTNFEIFSERLELRLSINEEDLEILDYYFSKTEDDVYKAAEGFAILSDKTNEYSENLEILTEEQAELQRQYENNEISQKDYIDGLDRIKSAALDNAKALQEHDKQMKAYYGDTLQKVGEEIGFFTNQLENLTNVLEHYNNILNLAGKSKDYALMKNISQAQVSIAENQVKSAQAEYAMYRQQADDWKAKMESVDKDSAEYAVYETNWRVAEEEADKAQDRMLSKTAEWMEKMKAVVEVKLNEIADALEKSLTGGISFDELLTQMERANSLQEEYYTDTNKIYETNKMIRAAQQEIDKTNNSVAKNRLKQFVNETNQLQNQTKLSKYELEIQQAKYDLLLAEIALEEAQQAKSTVRLTRDSEGNFGYVYTADQNQVQQAQQNLEDAQNALYNIGLEGANKYAEQQAQIMQEMHNTISEINRAWMNGEIESEEEYNRRIAAAKDYYFQKMKDNSHLYQVALTTDSRVVKDAYTTTFGSIMGDTTEFQKAIDTATSESLKILQGFSKDTKTALDAAGLNDAKTAINGIINESRDLTTILTGENGVIEALSAETKAVSDSVVEYGKKRTKIDELVTSYENLATAMGEAKKAEYGSEENDDESNDNTTNTSSDSSSSTDSSSNSPTLTVGSGVTVKTTATNFSRDEGNGTRMLSFVPGGNYEVLAISGNEVLIGRGGARTGWVHKSDLVGFDTGGYTGSWGSYGKLAFLDEKELVLNANDTANFLASMEVLERILSIIDLHSANAQLGGILSTPGFGHMNNQTIEQNVRIEASFPNVQNHSEIEEAFSNLINQASQYANRK